MNCDYYKAYDKRYKIVHDTNNLWEYFSPTPDVEKTINNLNIKDNILDLGCGEGRDAIYLLEHGYNIDACDYSIEAINTCNKITNNKYQNNFFQLDIFDNNLIKKYNFIYSVCVLHMFVLDEHRKKYLDFIYNHLNEDSYALIIVMGDNITNRETNIDNSFELEARKLRDTGVDVDVPKTSCKIVDRVTLNKELDKSNLKIEKEWLSESVPGFNQCMCTLVKRM